MEALRGSQHTHGSARPKIVQGYLAIQSAALRWYKTPASS